MGYRKLIVGDGGRDPMMVEAGYLAELGFGDRFEEVEDCVGVVD